MTDLKRAIRSQEEKLKRLQASYKFCKSVSEQIGHHHDMDNAKELISYLKAFDTSDQFVKS